ncbi:unnamed protein product [Cylindrotheca closterium]|uniref:Histidine kinase n=1 Tax=Cylindrotheca closterium TaxID=2856 RepID=A0AAD2CUQ8_9STRA|nr:unnamed protein product [Cylindrotheca closterium]
MSCKRQRGDEGMSLNQYSISSMEVTPPVEDLLHQYKARIEELELENARLKKQQVQVNTAKELYLKIFEDFPALIWRSGLDKECDYFNKTWLEWTGKTMEQEYGNGWTKGVHKDEFDSCLETYVKSFDKREAFYMEYRLLDKHGEYRWIGDHGRPFYDLDGTFLGYIGSCYDIHDAKLNEQQLRITKDKAVESDRLKSSFLANMSHEIRTPLNGVIGHIDLALSNGLDVEHREENYEGLKIARNSGKHLIMIIQDILDVSKIEAGQMDINNDEDFSLPSVIAQTKGLASSLLKQKKKEKIDFITTVDEGISNCLKGDEFRLQQVINNLCSNASKFTSAGRIELKVQKVDGNMLQFSVSDTGKGIPPSHLESIFAPFRQVEIGDVRQHGGTGLGLTICRHLVELMGGSLSVKSTVGENSGSNFSFLFPYRPCSNSKVDGSNRPSMMPQESSPHLINGKILVAEDDPVSRKLAQRMLTRNGYEVVLAKDGEEAVSCCKSHDDIALILMDVQMPKLDGINATKKIRAMEHGSKNGKHPIPILALSAAAMKGDEERGIEAGMTTYLTKPLNLKRVLSAIEKYAGSAKLDDPATTCPGISAVTMDRS